MEREGVTVPVGVPVIGVLVLVGVNEGVIVGDGVKDGDTGVSVGVGEISKIGVFV